MTRIEQYRVRFTVSNRSPFFTIRSKHHLFFHNPKSKTLFFPVKIAKSRWICFLIFLSRHDDDDIFFHNTKATTIFFHGKNGKNQWKMIKTRNRPFLPPSEVAKISQSPVWLYIVNRWDLRDCLHPFQNYFTLFSHHFHTHFYTFLNPFCTRPTPFSQSLSKSEVTPLVFHNPKFEALFYSEWRKITWDTV